MKYPKSIFGPIAQSPPTPPTIGQREDGSWYWLDETWNYGDDVRYETREAAQAVQDKYCAWLNGEIERY